ncbi:MAG: hypothetical protein ACREHD_03810 [Pirellulales bacterium]
MMQFRLRSIFYATAIAAVLCLLLPPLLRTVQHFLASKRPPPQPVRIVEMPVADPPEMAAGNAADAAPPDIRVPTDAVFIQTTIIRVNGKRIDAAAGPPAAPTPLGSPPWPVRLTG